MQICQGFYSHFLSVGFCVCDLIFVKRWKFLVFLFGLEKQALLKTLVKRWLVRFLNVLASALATFNLLLIFLYDNRLQF